MKRSRLQRTIRTFSGIILLGLWVSAALLAPRYLSASSIEITLDHDVHFLDPSGTDVAVLAGTYSLEAADSWLRLISAERRDAILVQAQAITHTESLTETMALSISGDSPDVYHLVLLLPEGKGLDAVGSLSGARSPDTTLPPLSGAELHAAIERRTSQPPSQDVKTRALAPVQYDSNPCLTDVRQEFLKLRTHGDQLGFWQGSEFPTYGYTWPQTGSHFQGIQRIRAGPYAMVSGSSDRVSHLFVVRLASRPGFGRFRSNRLASNFPPQQDAIVKVEGISSEYKHAGGLQVIGNYVVVGVEEGDKSKVVFYDIRNPEAPVKLPQEIIRGPGSGLPLFPMVDPQDPSRTVMNPNLSAGATGIAKRPDGRFLLLVARYNSNILDFYLSGTGDLRAPNFAYLSTWRESALRSENGMDREFGNYQNINILQQCNGQLYLIGLHKNTALMVVGEDWADLFRFEFTATNQAVITKVANRHMYCQFQCNFDAGGGVYVSPDRQLLLYGIEHWRHGSLIKFNEFRPVPPSVNPPLISSNGAWVELYDDVNFGDRSVMIDYLDRDRRNYTDYDQVGRIVPIGSVDTLWQIDGFEDKTSSAKWLLPPGWQYLLFQHKGYKGKMLPLVGTGNVQTISSFHSIGWNDQVSSSRFVKREITRIEEAWAELFDDSGFTDRRLTILGHAAPVADYKTITVEGQRGFGDKVSSARFQIPRGYVYRLYQHDNYGGKHLDLVGTGLVQEIPDFARFDFNDRTSSSKYVP